MQGSTPLRWVCTMIGAREHYALPFALHGADLLFRLYTDIWAGRCYQLARRGLSPFRALPNRHHPGIPDNAVVGFNTARICESISEWAHGVPQTVEERYSRYLAQGRSFALRVNEHLQRTPRLLHRYGLIGYDTGCLETQQLFAGAGLPSIVDQIDPARTEEDIVLAETKRWPGWQAIPGRIPETYYKRLEEEWRLANCVLVNSDWSKIALIRQGVPEEKIAVLPLCYDAASQPRKRPVGVEPLLTVLWLGQVILRKGIQYLIDAARLLISHPVSFVIAGPIGISTEALASAPDNCKFIGTVPRDRIGELYGNADLFVLPTLSDGFGLTQLEALANGLPVLTTPNCGKVVTHGEDGWIVPAGDALALAGAIEQALSNRVRLSAMSRKAGETATKFSVPQYGQQLKTILNKLA